MLRKLLASLGLSLALGISIPAFAATSQQSLVASRITEPVDESLRVVLKGNVHPLAQARYDRGAVAASMPASRMMLLLKHSPTQAAAAREYIDSLQDKNSPNYHKWLTPEQFGAQFGPSAQDLQTVTAWLQSHGFTVNRIAKARNVIEFSGTAGQVTEAFHASIHSYLVNGKQHFANASNPEIPAALSPVVAGVTQLHDFNPKKNSVFAASGRWNADTKRIAKKVILNDDGTDVLFVVPADAAVIYNTPNAKLNSTYTGKTYDGTGVTVGIAGDSNFTMQDVANYRAFFLNDSAKSHLPTVIVDGNDPGVTGDAVEALLDNEIVGGVAPGAKINFYTSQNTDVQAGLFLAIFRALDDNAVSILSVSFGGCEQGQGQAGNEQIYSAWEQAAAQGISVTISSGDSGSAGCDDDNTEQEAFDGLAVNGLGSTPYNVAVGGSDFGTLASNYPTSFNQYMKANGSVAPYYGSAASYIPETVWNDSSDNNTTLSLNVTNSTEENIVGAGGGRSSCSYEDASENCQGGYAKPAYQSNLTPSDGVRDLPDVALFASNGFSYATWAVCADNVALGDTATSTDCQLVNGKPTSTTMISGVGGTSAAAPAFAGILALINQSTGGRLGNPNPVLYALAKNQPTSFNDITVGNNSVSCAYGSPDCNSNSFLTGYDSETGYDLASGLGSVNTAVLLNEWPTAIFAPSSTTLQLGDSKSSLGTGALTAEHGAPIKFSAAVNPGASVTGNLTLVTDSDVSTLPSSGATGGIYPVNGSSGQDGVVTGSTNALPGGSYNLYAYYGGDTTYAASKSNPVPVNITQESSATTLALTFYDASTEYELSSTTSVPYGSWIFATATPQSKKNPGDGVATGTVAFRNGTTALGTPVSLDSLGVASFNSQNQSALPAGSYHLVASYSGDASFKPSNSAAASFTITKAQISDTLTASASSVSYGGSIVLTATLAADSIGNLPTGPITFMSGKKVLGSAPITSTGIVTATIAGTKFSTNGYNYVTAVYAGDHNYSASTSNNLGILVSGVPIPKIGLTGPTSLTVTKPGASTSASILITPFGGFTGAVKLTCSATGSKGTVSTLTCPAASATVKGTAAVTAKVTVESSSAILAGDYSLTITGTDKATGAVTASTTIPLIVNPAPIPSYTLSGTAAQIIAPGASAVSTITVTPYGGYHGAVALSCAASSAGLTCSKGTSSHNVATLHIHSASKTTPGTYKLTVKGADAATGKITASTTVSVTVSKASTSSIDSVSTEELNLQ